MLPVLMAIHTIKLTLVLCIITLNLIAALFSWIVIVGFPRETSFVRYENFAADDHRSRLFIEPNLFSALRSGERK